MSFISDHISEFEAQRVSKALKDAVSREDVENAFTVPNFAASGTLSAILEKLTSAVRVLREVEDDED